MRGGLVAPLMVLFGALPLGAEEADPLRGAEVFATHCAVCHGSEARGDGPMARVLLVTPPDLRGLARQNGGTFPATWVAYRIDGRSPIVSHGGDMPLFGRLFGMPDGAVASETGQPIVTAQPLADVVEFLRQIQDP